MLKIMRRLKKHHYHHFIETSTQVFQRKGYLKTSMVDLIQATGAKRHSINKWFGNKDGVFLACLKYYAKETTKEISAIIHKEPLGLHNIELFFHYKIHSESADNVNTRLLINMAIGKEEVNDKIGDWLRKYISIQEESFCKCLEAAQKNGEIPSKKDINLLTNYLMCFFEAINVMKKKESSKKILEMMLNEVMLYIAN